ncbi:hypothetical protein Hanom_Chr04g00346461 [Helianthus anomalus]
MGHNGSLEIPSCYFRVKVGRQHLRNGSMWVSVLDKRGRFWVGMGSVQIEFRAETVSARRRFWIGTGSGRVSGGHGFLHGTGFGSQRVVGRHEFPHETSFRSGRVSYRFDLYRFDANRFDTYLFDANRFDQYP